ncbi:AraC family transcriptional regulator [Niveibacterium microcysteis]|uniref:AraC family transcriptional regulator n=1 Tax=Niveibacterium microcysteis TaxID=2811415 RepID=A0ABX7MAY1_9RHOO|nr:AraC family transcriptional regulator [Niveibacterium microcysteis]QSI76637.1 AraC family transcriptional regulator [Niveibacterium microcysteis]
MDELDNSEKQLSPREGQLRVSIIAYLPGALRGLCIDPEPLLAARSLTEADLRDQDRYLDYATVGWLLNRGAQISGRPDLPLLVAAQGGTRDLGAVGRLMRAAPDVRSALRSLVDSMHVHDTGAVVALAIEGELVYLSYGVYVPDCPGCEHLNAGAILMAYRLLKEICGPRWRPLDIRLPCRRPDRPHLFSQHFGSANIRYQSEISAVVFSKAWLDYPNALADQGQARANVPAPNEALTSAPIDLRHFARRQLRTMILTHDTPCQASLANALGVHERTLNRIFQRYATTFRKELSAARREVASQLLRDTDLTAGQIAAYLGYSDCSAFGRAFTKACGVSPDVWRHRKVRSA